jgi:hypothetical protein
MRQRRPHLDRAAPRSIDRLHLALPRLGDDRYWYTTEWIIVRRSVDLGPVVMARHPRQYGRHGFGLRHSQTTRMTIHSLRMASFFPLEHGRSNLKRP